MKKTLKLIILSVTILLFSCGSISVKKDDFTGATVVKMPLLHFSNTFIAGQMEAMYVKEYKSGSENPTVVQVKISTPTTYTFPEDELLIKINGTIYSAKITDVSGEIHTQYNNGMVTQYKLYNAQVHLTEEVENQLKNADEIAYRVNMGADKTITYKLKSDDINKIKKFLATNPEKG